MFYLFEGPYTCTMTVGINYTASATPPGAPTFKAPSGSGSLCNLKPRALITMGTSTGTQSLSNASPAIQASATSGLASGRKIVIQRSADIPAEAGVTSFTFRTTDATTSGTRDVSSPTVAVNTPIYNQPTLTAKTTKVKAVDITELRAMLANICAYYGMSAPTWASGAVTANTTKLSNWTTHINELRTCIDSIRAHVNGWDNSNTALDIPAVSWLAITANCPRVDVLQQIRNAIKTL
jgi:hypothetical protein